MFYYKQELSRTHPDSTIQIQYENERSTLTSSPRFKRIYICLGPLKVGWKRFCRPIIFLDACFLRGMYKRQLFTAIDIDPNNGGGPLLGQLQNRKATNCGNGFWNSLTTTWIYRQIHLDMYLCQISKRCKIYMACAYFNTIFIFLQKLTISCL